MKKKVLIAASVASMIDQFNMPNIRLLQEMGYEVHVLCNFREGNTCSRRRIQTFKKTLRAMHVVGHQWDCPREIFPVKNCLRAYRTVLELTGKIHFAWIHCHSPVGGALARMAANVRGIRVIYTAHGFHFYQGAPVRNWILYYPVEKMLSYRTDVLVTINREDYCFAKRHLKAGAVRYTPGVGIDPGRFQIKGDSCRSYIRRKVRGKYRIPDGAVLLLSVGELSGRKNHQAVLRALASLRRADIYYLICGQGECRDALKALAGRLGIAGQVRLAGYVEHVEDIYQAADIFVFPSFQEGLPAALMEAMASGLACVVSDIRGNRELVDERGGRRFSPDSPRQLAAMLRILLASPQRCLAYGRHNRKKVESCRLEIVQRTMREIYSG